MICAVFCLQPRRHPYTVYKLALLEREWRKQKERGRIGIGRAREWVGRKRGGGEGETWKHRGVDRICRPDEVVCECHSDKECFACCVSDSGRLQSADGQLSERVKVRVHAWTAVTSRLANAIWLMAVAQHQFYLDCKHNKVGRSVRLASVSTFTTVYRVTTWLENLEMSGNLEHVREKILSWKSVPKLFITRWVLAFPSKTVHSYIYT